MSFNVNQFMATIERHGGLTKTNLFSVEITPPPWYLSILESSILPDLRFFCNSVNLPSISINTEEYKRFNYGPSDKRPTSFELEPINGLFFMDNNHRVLNFFHAWLNQIYNYDYREDYTRRYFQRYKSEYTTTIEIKFFSTTSGTEEGIQKYYTYRLKNAYPTDVGSIQIAWADNNSVSILPVTFTYSDLEIDTGNAENIIFGSLADAGFFSRLFQLGSVISAVSTIERPTNVQDAINQYTNVSTITNTIL